ncbi:MAG: family 20 glycosylhydrolase [Acidobacteria bacterium]|nr:family 20 glycosylhydrolase [Acidobacteriota bacterium]
MFPLPQEIEQTGADFRLDERTNILVPQDARARDLFAARLLSAELSDRYRLAIRVRKVSSLPNRVPYIVIGPEKSPLVAEAMRMLDAPAAPQAAEAYALVVRGSAAVVAGNDEAGAFYGLQSLRQLIVSDADGVRLRAARIRDWPHTPFRGIRLYVPGRENIAFLKRFLRDFMALYKYNRLIMEVNAAMRFDRRPELNAGWIELGRSLNTTRRSMLWGAKYMRQNSVHHDTGDGGVIEKEEVADIVRYAEQHGIQVIPEVPALSHSYYLLTRHRELAEVQDAEWPDTYCPLNPKSYELLFDVLDEVVEVFHPKMVHIGHDEWVAPIGVCPRCGDKDHRELFGQDVQKIYGYLKARGIQVAMWHDMIIEGGDRGSGIKVREYRPGYAYPRWGALSPEQVRRLIPKDVLVGNWFWRGEGPELALRKLGFKQFFGNMTPQVAEQGDYGERLKRPGMLGGAASSWAATTEANFGKDLIDGFLGCANLLWSAHWPAGRDLNLIVDSLKPDVRSRLSGVQQPSDRGEPVVPVDLARYAQKTPGTIELGDLRVGPVAAGAKRFVLPDSVTARAIVVGSRGEGPVLAPPESQPIKIGEDATSLLFLHATSHSASNRKAYAAIYNFADTADLLGWYEITFADGFILTIPIRYGVNIASADGASKSPYAADAIECGREAGTSVRFFAFEWVNPRLGKVITQVRLKGASRFEGPPDEFRGQPGQSAKSNAIILAAVSFTMKRAAPPPPPSRSGR